MAELKTHHYSKGTSLCNVISSCLNREDFLVAFGLIFVDKRHTMKSTKFSTPQNFSIYVDGNPQFGCTLYHQELYYELLVLRPAIKSCRCAKKCVTLVV